MYTKALYLLQSSGWRSASLADQGPVALAQHTAQAETPVLLAWALFLTVLVLLAVSLWLYYGCTRLGSRAAHYAHWRERQCAEERAAGLLREHVSERQYQQFRRDGYLEVPSQVQPGRVYRLPARPGRVVVYEGGRPVGQLCVIATEPVPQADLILAQKWLIEADEPAYLALANWVSGSPRGRTGPELELLHT